MEAPAAAVTEDNELIHDFPPFCRVYKSGRVERILGTTIIPAGDDPKTGVSSKDVTFFPGLSARLFLPRSARGNEIKNKKLPVLVYYHGGGFIIERSVSPVYTTFLNTLCAEAGVLAVSVEYRRAPEHPLPAAYDDSFTTLQWVLSHSPDSGVANPASRHSPVDPWLADHGDFDKVILGGDSAGANIVHQMLLRRLPAQLFGAMLIHPFFWGTTKVGHRSEGFPGGVEKLWRFVCPETSGVDDPWLNPLAEPGEIARVGCGRMLVCVAEKDFLNDWGRAYHRGVTSSGWGGTAEMVETEGEDHVFHLFKPDSDEARAFIHCLAAFITGEPTPVL